MPGMAEITRNSMAYKPVRNGGSPVLIWSPERDISAVLAGTIQNHLPGVKVLIF